MLIKVSAFGSFGDTVLNHIARWNGSAWMPLGEGLDGPVLALEAFDDGFGSALYAGGEFSSAGSVTSHGVARWNGASWSGLSGGVTQSGGTPGEVYALKAFDDGSGPALFVGGRFSAAGSLSR